MSTLETKQATSMTKFGEFLLSRGSTGFDLLIAWLVKDFFPLMAFGVIYGLSGVFKSFLAIDIICCIATGRPWNGKAVQKGAVLYIAAEGQLGISRRIRAWEITNGEKADNVFVLGHSVYMAEEEAQQATITAIEEIKKETGEDVQMVVIDTLARCFTGDENTSRDMNAFIRGCDVVRAKTNVSILCIHHSGRDEKKGARGSTALKAACDFEFQVKRNGKVKLMTFINTKQKEGQEAPDTELELDTIDLGIICEEQLPITSLARTKDATVKSTEKSADTHPILKMLSSKFDGKATRDDLRAELFPQSDKKLTDAQRQSFGRTLKMLKSEGRINIEQITPTRASGGDIIYLVH